MKPKYYKEVFENEKVISYYDSLTQKFGIFRSEILIICKYFNKEDSILDLGCGTGRTTLGLYNLGYKNIIGVDVSKGMIKKAKNSSNSINYIVSNILFMPFKSEYFNCAFFSFNGLMLMPNFQDRLNIFLNVYNLIKDNGYFIFSTPFLDNKINSEYWSKKLNTNDINNYSLGDILIDDMGLDQIFIHIPFISEIMEYLDKSNFSLIEIIQRKDLCEEIQELENHLDDNLYWVVKKNEKNSL